LTTFWRVSQHRDLKGAGGLRAPGRWHERGLPVVYLAESPAGALLEVCVHTSANDIPPLYTLLEIKVEARIEIETLDASVLPKDWIQNVQRTRELGSAWLRTGKRALLRIPSSLVPATFNVMLNPLHPDAARLRIQSVTKYPFDPRIKK
jgi:RES domain-containing protein